MSALQLPPGWYGKLPTLGDFASRRLSSELIEAWDGWLAAGLVSLRSANPGGWLDAYLVSPRWRFLLMPGVLPGEAGQQAWAGVLMPSVDKVGRYFPFTLLQPLGELPASTQQMAWLWSWLARLDELAADALHDDWTLERLEQELAGMQGPGLAALPAEILDPAVYIGAEAQAVWARKSAGRAYWAAGELQEAPRLVVSDGLPGDAGGLLGGGGG